MISRSIWSGNNCPRMKWRSIKRSYPIEYSTESSLVESNVASGKVSEEECILTESKMLSLSKTLSTTAFIKEIHPSLGLTYFTRGTHELKQAKRISQANLINSDGYLWLMVSHLHVSLAYFNSALGTSLSKHTRQPLLRTSLHEPVMLLTITFR